MIDINIQEKQWDSICSSITSLVKLTILNIEEARNKKISILLTNDKQMRDINKQFRKQDKPTNVLSFPYDNFPDGTIGDVILAFETIAKEAEELNITFKTHMAHMLIHGVLHLLGYTHDNDEDAEVMESLEDKILLKLKTALMTE